MTGNLWVWRALLTVLLVVAVAVVLPVAAQSTVTTEPLTWTLTPTPGITSVETLTEVATEETSNDETLEMTPDEAIEEETPRETQDAVIESATTEETLTGAVENETPEETLIGTVENETPEESLAGPASNTTNETRSAIVVEMDEVTPAETSTAALPTFTPIQTAQVDESVTQAAPPSPAGIVLAIAAAAFAVVFGRTRR